MALNIEYIDGSIDEFRRTSYLATQIKADVGDFLTGLSTCGGKRREYLSQFDLRNKLAKSGFRGRSLDEMLAFIQDSVTGAFERGVFVVSSRVVKMPPGVNISDPDSLLGYLRDKELEYFTPKLWYPDGTYTKGLLDDRWHEDVANEWGPYVLRHCRVAFEIGMKRAVEKLVRH